jgi:hypothetical protein
MKIKNISIIILLGIIMIACTPTKREEIQIVKKYERTHSLFICKVDSSAIEIQVMAKDKYQAMKYFDWKLSESDITSSYKVTEYSIELLQNEN